MKRPLVRNPFVKGGLSLVTALSLSAVFVACGRNEESVKPIGSCQELADLDKSYRSNFDKTEDFLGFANKKDPTLRDDVLDFETADDATKAKNRDALNQRVAALDAELVKFEKFMADNLARAKASSGQTFENCPKGFGTNGKFKMPAKDELDKGAAEFKDTFFTPGREAIAWARKTLGA